MGLFNILMYALLIYMVIRVFTMNKTVNKRRQVINVVNKVFEEDEFFAAADQLIGETDDAVIETKTRIIRLWGKTLYKKLDTFEEELNDINIGTLFKTGRNGSVSIAEDEDSFFYLILSTPNMLYGIDRIDLADKIFEKLQPYEDRLNDQLTKAVADRCMQYYKKEDDLGEQFFRNVDEGEYPGYKYSKQLIGIYKNICDTMLCKILDDRGEDWSEYEGYVRSFANMGVGQRWIRSIGLPFEFEEEEEENKNEFPAFETDEKEEAASEEKTEITEEEKELISEETVSASEEETVQENEESAPEETVANEEENKETIE